MVPPDPAALPAFGPRSPPGSAPAVSDREVATTKMALPTNGKGARTFRGGGSSRTAASLRSGARPPSGSRPRPLNSPPDRERWPALAAQRRRRSTTPSPRPSRCRRRALIVTADEPRWALTAAASDDRLRHLRHRLRLRGRHRAVLAADETPDGRPGVAVLFFAHVEQGPREAARQPRRPVRADLPDDGLLQRPAPATRRPPLGGTLRFFGDGFQISKQLDGRRYWRMPVMDGEFLVRGRRSARSRASPAATS